MAKPSIALIETNAEAVIESYDKCDAGNCDGCAFESIHRDWPAACAFYQRESGRYLLKKLAEQTPRVLTLEEVRQMGQRNMHHGKAPRETCVYERRGCIGLATCSPLWDEPQFEGDQSHLDIQYLFLGTDEYDVVPVKKYGFEIRCWHGCPTDEQREAIPWK